MEKSFLNCPLHNTVFLPSAVPLAELASWAWDLDPLYRNALCLVFTTSKCLTIRSLNLCFVIEVHWYSGACPWLLAVSFTQCSIYNGPEAQNSGNPTMCGSSVILKLSISVSCVYNWVSGDADSPKRPLSLFELELIWIKKHKWSRDHIVFISHVTFLC